MKNGYLKEAKWLFGLAKKEYSQAKKRKSEIKVRQAAEKGYLCLLRALDALFIANGAKESLPKGERGRIHFLFKYADKDDRDKYHKIKYSFHIDAFHEGIIIYEDLDEQFEDLEGLINKIETASHN